MKKENQDRLIMKNIFKNVFTAKRKCLLCNDLSINSHLLQKNGILNNISVNGHIIQMRPKDFAVDHADGIIDIKKIGINRGMLYFLFCNSHDTTVFNNIEQKKFDISEYQNQLLFSYRSLCAEYRKKEMNIDIFSRIINSHLLATNYNLIDLASIQKEANEMGNLDILFYKDEFEKELFHNSVNSFVFEVFEFDFLPLSASAVYTPIDPKYHTMKYLQNPKNTLNIMFVNIIPINNKLYILFGYHKDKIDNWIKSYISSWKEISNKELSEKLTDLVSTKIETWAISPEYFEQIAPEDLRKFKKYWNEHAMDLRINQNIDFNLFS